MKYNFVIPLNGKYSNHSEFKGDIDKEWWYFNNGQWAWIIQTYHRLKNDPRISNLITYSNETKVECINIIFSDDYIVLKEKHKYYCMVILQDRRVFFPGNFNITQNKNHLIPFSYQCITLWSQAGLIEKMPKDIDEDNINIGFFGLDANSEKIDVILHNGIKDKKINFLSFGPNNWNDYSNVDVVIAIRDFKQHRHIQKPPTKLLNAWKGKVPFIGGSDTAYSDLGINGINYLRVETPDELITQLKELIGNSEFRNKLIKNGEIAFQSYTNDKISEEWISCLNQQNYNEWQKKWNIIKKANVLKSYIYYNFLRLKRRILVIQKKY